MRYEPRATCHVARAPERPEDIQDISRESSQVKFLLSTQIQNSPPLVPGAGSLRRRQNLNHPGAR